MVAAALQKKARHPEQRFTKEGSGRARGDLVVDRGKVGLAGHLPDKAAHVVVGERLPEGDAGRPRKSEHGRSLVRMAELIYVEGIRVENPVLLVQVLPRALQCRIVDIVRDRNPVVDAE